MLWTVANGALGQQTFENYATYILAQHTNTQRDICAF